MFFQHVVQIALRFRRLGPQFDRVAKPGGCLFQVAVVQCRAAFGDIQICILAAIVSGDELTAFLELGRSFLMTSRPRQSQAQLIVTFSIVWLEARRLLQFVDGFSHSGVLKQGLAKRQMRARERRCERDDLSQLLDLFRRPAAWTGVVRRREIELRFDRAWRQRNRLLQFADGFFGVGRREGRPQVGMRLCIIGAEAYSLTQRCDARFIVARLDEDESQVVVRFCKVRMQPNRFAEFGRHLARVGARATEQAAQHVVRVGPLRICSQCLAKSGNGVVPVGCGTRRRREVQRGF